MGVYTCGPHQPIRLTQFNPGSGKHIVWWVERLLGPQNWLRTEKGNPKTDADTLELMFSEEPFIKPLLHYFEVNKLLGQLAEGPKAWLRFEREGKIHHEVDILGAVTGRATHRNPNLAQVPSIRKYKGVEARKLFKPRPGWVQVGCDLSGVELRCLAHYMYVHDKGEYARQILEGDIHTVNQEAAGLPTRDNAKTFIYGFLYGAGDAKIGLIVGGDKKRGRQLKQSFLRKLPALKKLIDGVQRAAKRGYLIGITGRRLYVRSPHAALNVLLQSLGGYIAKQWMVVAHDEIKERGLRCAQLGWIHDELQFEVHPDDADELMSVLEQSSLIAGEQLGMRMPIHSEAKKGADWSECH
jgi:DNA polymerase I-like protein with 3'-5' exonuclease and polymerase domains